MAAADEWMAAAGEEERQRSERRCPRPSPSASYTSTPCECPHLILRQIARGCSCGCGLDCVAAAAFAGSAWLGLAWQAAAHSFIPPAADSSLKRQARHTQGGKQAAAPECGAAQLSVSMACCRAACGFSPKLSEQLRLKLLEVRSIFPSARFLVVLSPDGALLASAATEAESGGGGGSGSGSSLAGGSAPHAQEEVIANIASLKKTAVQFGAALSQMECPVIHLRGNQHMFSCYDVDKCVRLKLPPVPPLQRGTCPVIRPLSDSSHSYSAALLYHRVLLAAACILFDTALGAARQLQLD